MQAKYTVSTTHMPTNNTNNTYRQDLKGRILDEAIRLFLKSGIRQVRMDDIARSLVISKRTLYEVYDNKEQLLLDVVKKRDNETTQILAEYAGNGADTIDIIVGFYHLQMREFSTVNPLFFEEMHAYKKVMDYLRDEHDKKSGEVRQFITEAIREGYFMDDLEYDIIFQILDAASEYVMNAGMYKKYGLKTVFHNFTMVFLRGICTEKGIARLDKLMFDVEK